MKRSRKPAAPAAPPRPALQLDYKELCLDYNCGHRRGIHKGGTGYCCQPGCPCYGFIATDAELTYYRRETPPDE